MSQYLMYATTFHDFGTLHPMGEGARKPQLDNLRKLAALLDVSMSSLIEDDPEHAVSKEERIAIRMLRDMTPEMRQAMLALMKAQVKS